MERIDCTLLAVHSMCTQTFLAAIRDPLQVLHEVKRSSLAQKTTLGPNELGSQAPNAWGKRLQTPDLAKTGLGRRAQILQIFMRFVGPHGHPSLKTHGGCSSHLLIGRQSVAMATEAVLVVLASAPSEPEAAGLILVVSLLQSYSPLHTVLLLWFLSLKPCTCFLWLLRT